MRRPARPGAPEGGLAIDKPAGLTSHDVVAAVRRALGQPRVGHTGTLDPLATGVLLLLLGRATRLAQYLSTADKTYLATIAFGQATSTYDAAGAPVGPASPDAVDAAALDAALAGFSGRFEQVPPAVSAKKVQGTRAYALARQGQPAPLAPVEVEVSRLDLVAFDGRQAQVRVTASAGFYVRSLAHDLGQRLGTGAHLTGLRRERSGAFGLDACVPLDRLVTDPAAAAPAVTPMAALLADWPSARLSPAECEQVRRGQAVARDGAGGPERVALLDTDGGLVGVGRRGAGVLHPVLVLV